MPRQFLAGQVEYVSLQHSEEEEEEQLATACSLKKPKIFSPKKKKKKDEEKQRLPLLNETKVIKIASTSEVIPQPLLFCKAY